MTSGSEQSDPLEGETELVKMVPDRKCPICDQQAKLICVGDDLYWRYSCACGLTSKLFSDKWEAKEWWNTRGGKCVKKYRRPEISVGPRRSKISGVTLENGTIPRTPADLGHPTPPKDAIDDLNKEVEKSRAKPSPF